MKKAVNIILVSLMVCVLSGCGSGGDTSDLETSSVEINKDGTVTSIIIDTFGESYYDVDELKSMAEEEIDAFNLTNGEDSVKLVSVDKTDDNIKVVTKFTNSEIYAHFNYETFMYGTLSDLQNNGQTIAGDFVDADGNAVTADVIAELSDEHIIITSNKTIVAAPYKIKYISSGATLIGSYMADLSQTDPESVVYIVLNK